MTKHIHIKLKSCLLFSVAILLLTMNAYSQENPIKVSGKVVDVKGEALIGVAVRVKDINTGTVTDVDGNFCNRSQFLGTVLSKKEGNLWCSSNIEMYF